MAGTLWTFDKARFLVIWKVLSTLKREKRYVQIHLHASGVEPNGKVAVWSIEGHSL